MKKTLVIATTALLVAAWPFVPGKASSHREAPLITQDPQADATDVYVFVSPDKPDTVTFVTCWIPFENPAGGPNFYRFGDNVLYEIKIDNTGDAVEDITYQFRFTSQTRNPNTFLYNTGIISSLDDPDRNMYQTYTMTRVNAAGQATLIAGPMFTMPDNVGAGTPNYGGFGSGIYQFNEPGGSGLVFAGQTDDPFFLDLRVFDLLYGGNLSEAGNDTLAGYNVHTIALQVPKALVRGGTPIIGVWTTASRPAVTTRAPGSETPSGALVQVSRLGAPLVNEVVIPVGQKDRWNGSRPIDDAQFATHVLDPEVPKLLQLIYGIPPTPTPRNDLVSVFLTGVPGLNQPPGVRAAEMIRLNTDYLPTARPHRLGVIGGDPAGYPNGRRLADDALDITVLAAAGVLTGVRSSLSDGVNANDVPFRTSFPYIAFPHSGGKAANLKSR